MKLQFPQRVRQEVEDVIAYYDAERPGLGALFWFELENAVKRILADPNIPRLRPGDYRRVNLRTYPYYVAYAIRGEFVVLLAISHVARKPEYWIKR
jgi:plasmid stabilization system protein ParE